MGLLEILITLCLVCQSSGEYRLEGIDKTSSNFRIIARTPLFVDKTSFINTFFGPNEWKVVLTAPRRFGKSTNLDMMRRFCEVNVNRNGSRIAKELTENFKVFSDMYNKSGTYEHLDVYKKVNTSNFFNKTFGEYPVIYLDFKSLVATSCKKFVRTFRLMVRKEFRRHKYLLESNGLSEKDVKVFNRYIDWKGKRHLDHEELSVSMAHLSKFLCLYFNKRVIVFIDEFDAPVQENIFGSGEDVETIIDLIQKFTGNLFKSNPNVERALLIGTLNYEVLSGGVNDIEYLSFAHNHKFKFYYGFTEDEMFKLGNKLGLKKDIMKVIDQWYNGYRVLGSYKRIYNVWSIINYLEGLIFDNYWAKEDPHINLKKLGLSDIVYDKIVSAILCDCSQIIYILKLNVEHVVHLKELVSDTKYTEVSETDAILYLNFLLALGYFTVVNTYTDKEKIMYNLTIPNNEIKNEILRNFDNHFLQRRFSVSRKAIDSYVASVMYLDDEKSSFEEFGRCVLELFKNRGYSKNERQLLNPVAAFLWYDNIHFRLVESEYETGKGKFIDLLIIREDSTGLIIELGSNEKSSLEALAKIVHENNTYDDVFDANEEMKVENRIFIGLYLDSKGTCNVSYLYNSVDIRESRTIAF